MNLALFKLAHDLARENAAKACRSMPAGTVVTFAEPTRSLEQNSKMWPMLEDIARQVEWPVDGRMQLLKKEDWKVILTAGLRKNQRVAQGIDGGFCLLGDSTSRMSVKEMRALIEFIGFFGDSKQVAWSEPREWAA